MHEHESLLLSSRSVPVAPKTDAHVTARLGIFVVVGVCLSPTGLLYKQTGTTPLCVYELHIRLQNMIISSLAMRCFFVRVGRGSGLGNK